MQHAYSEWKRIRTKTDEATADPDWVGTNVTPVEPVGSASITIALPDLVHMHGAPVTGVECFVIGVDANRAPVARSTNTCDLAFVEVVNRTRSALGGTAGDAVALIDCSSSATTNVPLQRKVYFELNGAELFTIRISNNTGITGVDRLEVWIRGVSR